MGDTAVHLCSYLTKNNLPLPSSSISCTRPLFTVYQGPEISAEEAQSRVVRLASLFSHELGISPGDRIATLAQVTPNHLETLLAATAAGCIAAPLNWRWSVSETVYGVKHIEAKVLCADGACLLLAKQVMELCPSVKVLVILGNADVDVQNKNRKESNGTDISRGGRKYRTLRAEGLLQNYNKDPLSSTKKYFQEASPPPLKLKLLQRHDGAAFIIFTSGTTGPPKAAVLSHNALHLQCTAKLHCCNYNASDVYLHTAQFFHVGGLCNALAMLLAGAQHVFLPVFRAAECLKAIEMYNITSFIAVPTIINDLLTAAASETKAFEGRKNMKFFPHVQSVLIGAGGLSQNLITGLSELIPNADIYAAYGMTEACSSLTFSTLFNRKSIGEGAGIAIDAVAQDSRKLLTNDNCGKSSSGVYVGCPPPGIELAILPLIPSVTTSTPPPATTAATKYKFENDIILEFQGYGEVLTRGPHTMLRYWNDPEATSANFLPSLSTSSNSMNNSTSTNSTTIGRWMRTGDLGYLKTTTTAINLITENEQQQERKQQQQHLWLVGRAKDVIKTGGENVPAAEVERALLTHPAVSVAAVVGVPDDRLGDRVAAVVVMKSGYTWQGSSVYAVELEKSALVNEINKSSINRSGGGGGEKNNPPFISGLVLQQHCRSVAGLAGFKLPRTFFLVDRDDEIPRNATGKVIKPQLREVCIQKMNTTAVAATTPINKIRSRL